jgi:hypothetical protein
MAATGAGAATEAAMAVPAPTMEKPATMSRMDNDNVLGFHRRRHRQQRAAQNCGGKD